MAGTGTAHLRDTDDVLLRIEDLVVVQDGKPEILTTFTKDLLTLD